MSLEQPVPSEVPQPKDIILSDEQYSFLSTANPDSEEVASFLESHGLTFGDTIHAHVAGKENVVALTTDKEDFFTGITKETAALAGVEVQRHHEALVEEASEDLAEEAFESIGGPVDPSESMSNEFSDEAVSAQRILGVEPEAEVVATHPESTQQPELEQARHYYRQRMSETLEGAQDTLLPKINSIEQSADDIDGSLRYLSILGDEQGAAASIQKVANALEVSEHTPDGARKVLIQSLDETRNAYARLHGVASELMSEIITKSSHAKNVIAETGEQLAMDDRNFNEHVGALASRDPELKVTPEDEADTSELQEKLLSAGVVLDGFSDDCRMKESNLQNESITLRSAITMLDMIIQNSYAEGLDAGELRALAQQIKAVSGNVEAIRVSGQVAETVTPLRNVLAAA